MRFSKPILVASAGIVLLPILSASLGAAPGKPEGESEAELLNRIEKLEARVSELEKKAAKPASFGVQTEPFFFTPGAVRSGDAKMPPGSIEHQFNGGTYYVVPVAQPENSK
jgi:hypothetical protein